MGLLVGVDPSDNPVVMPWGIVECYCITSEMIGLLAVIHASEVSG